MKKLIYIFMLLLPFMMGTVPSMAMPPHPDLLKKWQDEGRLDTMMKKVDTLTTRKSLNSNKSSSIGSGTIKIPVVLVAYSGSSFDGVSTSTFYSNLLNGVTDSSLSVKKYYKDMSAKSLTIQFDVYTLSSTVSQSGSYYGTNVDNQDDHPGQLVNEAVTLMVSQYSSTDFSQYDNDKDGDVDVVIVIHVGSGEEKSGVSTEIWSHQWDLYSANYYGDGAGVVSTDGVSFNVYTIQPEYVETAGDTSIGVYCHEFGHALGLPDLYDTSYETNGAGYWSLMAGGSWGSANDGKDPAPLLAWERYKIGGESWVSFAEINPNYTIGFKNRDDMQTLYLLIAISVFLLIVLGKSYKIAKSVTMTTCIAIVSLVFSCSPDPQITKINGSIDDIESSHQVYKISLSNKQSLILEGKLAAATTDWFVPGTGVLITHIHEGIISSYPNSVNAGLNRVHGVNIVEAKTSTDIGKLWTVGNYYGTADDLFCLENKESLTLSTTPSSQYYKSTEIDSKTGDSGVKITSFSSKNQFPITFNVRIEE